MTDSSLTSTGTSNIRDTESFAWVSARETIIISSVVRITNTSIKSSSSSTRTSRSYVWYGLETTAASTFEFVNCSITSSGVSTTSADHFTYSFVWVYGQYSSLTNTTHSLFNCSISSFSSGVDGASCVWYFRSKSMNQTAFNIHNSSIVISSSGDTTSHFWAYDFRTAPKFLVGIASVVAHCTVRLLCPSSLCRSTSLMRIDISNPSTRMNTNTFYWYASSYLLGISSGGGSTPQSLSPGYQCGGASDCGGMLVLVDNRSTPFVQPTPPTRALSTFAVSTNQKSPVASSDAWVEWAEADELCSVMTASGTVRPTAGTDSLSVTHTLFVSSEASGTSTRSSTVTLSISGSASTSHSSSAVLSSSFSSAPTPTPSISFSISDSLPLDSSSLSLSPSPQPTPSRTYSTSLRPLASMSALPTASNQATASRLPELTRSLSLSSSLFRSAETSSRSHHTASLPLSVTRTQLVLAPIPAGLTRLAEEVTAAASPVVGILAVAGVSGGQLGALGGMARMAKCAADGSDDESRDASGLPVLVHPLRFSLFSARGESGKTPAGPLLGQYAAAAVSNGAVIPLTVWLAVYWAVPWFVTRCARVIGCATAPTEDDVRSHLGWPCAMVSPFATFAEGTAVSVVLLWRSGIAHAIVCGAIGCLSMAVVLGWWVRRMHVFIPPSRLRLHTILTNNKAAFCDDDYTEEGKGMLSWYVWCRLGSILDFLGPTHEWVVGDGSLLSAGEGDATVEKAREVDHQEGGLNRTYILEKGTKFGAVEGAESFKRLLRDKRWYYAELVSVLCSLVVGVAEGMPSTGASCSARAAVAMVAVAVQCACGCATFVRYELVLQVLITICTVPMGVLVVCLSSGFVDGVDTEGRILEVMSALNIVANIVGLALVLCQTAGVVLALRKSRSVRARRRATVTHWTEPPATDLEATLTIADEIFGPLTDSSVLLVLPMSPCDAQQNVAPTDEREAERIRGKRLPPPSWVSELLDDVELVVGASV